MFGIKVAEIWSGETVSLAAVWFERKFKVSFPVELWPNVCARLRGTPARPSAEEAAWQRLAREAMETRSN